MAAERKKRSEEAKKMRDLKKFGKQVQVAKLQEREKAKKETLEKIQVLKRSEFLSDHCSWRFVLTAWGRTCERGHWC